MTGAVTSFNAIGQQATAFGGLGPSAAFIGARKAPAKLLPSNFGLNNGRAVQRNAIIGGGPLESMRAATGRLPLSLAAINDQSEDSRDAQTSGISLNDWQTLLGNEDLTAALAVDSHTLFSQNGIFDAGKPIPEHLNLFIEQCDDVMDKVRAKVEKGEMSLEKATGFQSFLVKIGNNVMNHPIIAKNAYLERFRDGVTPAQARNELQQFSVFAFQFNVSLAKMIANADSQEEWETYTTILANEMGAPFAQGFDGELKGTFNIQKHNHHTWLMDNAKDLGLTFKEIGGLNVAHSGTKAFVEAIDRYYTSNDRNVRGGAAFAIENWAAAKFWPLWLEGVTIMNKGLPKAERAGLSYIKYHDIEERHHSKETIDELLEAYMEDGFEPNTYLSSAVKMLDEGVQAYYTSQLDNMPDKDDSWPDSIVSKS